jgi:hypothetical protein
MVPPPRWRRRLRLGAALVLAAAAAQASNTITGVCPDGSIFIVKRAADVPCRDARRVEPQDVPPIKPEFLPRPYAWQLFQQQQDPNNPYNLVEAARRVREAGEAGESPPEAQAAPPAQPPQSAAPSEAPAPQQMAMVRTEPPLREPEGFGFSEEEIQDLFLIVELAQRRAPATFTPEVGREVVVRVAQSNAFGTRFRELRTQRGKPATGPVVLFSAVAQTATRFHANLTFVQGHMAYQPDTGNQEQFGLLYGRLGELQPQEAVLGYVVLPAGLDPSQPMDIYWNDRRLTATLGP